MRSDSDTTCVTASASRPGSEWVNEGVNGGIMLPQEGRRGEAHGMKEWATSYSLAFRAMQYARNTGGADSSYLIEPQKQLPLRGEDGVIVDEEDVAISYKGQNVEPSLSPVQTVSHIMCTWHGHANDYSSESLKHGQCEWTSCEHLSVDHWTC